MNWDPFQREALAELGHRLYRVRMDEARAPLEAPASSGTVDPLWRALVRAAGTDALPQVELAALRRDPAAKRALWPRLRMLRGAARAR
ncbi:hypothetical protein FNZ56_11440 [Pseudoluteimonas lycopersici]|uniref:Uncharacterized protein n=1 Tax=Pseudoluteimonas lycopersici TaxID=1324796 RepID=A0A516V7F5_9GAMM|nr:hypothetical protein [Lysobacter lycopersici]QDQ74450.1 hypothetical protein FNZ56_11440 [Lysobacter lycopersici]